MSGFEVGDKVRIEAPRDAEGIPTVALDEWTGFEGKVLEIDGDTILVGDAAFSLYVDCDKRDVSLVERV